MKHKGSISQTYLKRDRDTIPEIVRRAKHVVDYPTNLGKIFNVAANLPVNAYYIADDSAIDYVRDRRSGRHRRFSNPYKQRLYESLYEEVEKMVMQTKYREMSMKDVVIIALTHPAPCVGLAPTGIRKIYTRLRYKKQKRD